MASSAKEQKVQDKPSAGLKLDSPKRNRLDVVKSGTKVVYWLWNQFLTSDTVTRNVGQCHHRALTSAHDLYFALSARRHRRTTGSQAPLGGRAHNLRNAGLQPSCKDWPLRQASSLVRPFTCIQQERLDIVEPKTPVIDTTRMRLVLFSDESKCTKKGNSRRVLTWRENGARFYPSFVTKIDRFGDKGIIVCGGITTGMCQCTFSVLVLSTHSAIGMRFWKLM
ncbi:hypothetical protein TNCV_4662921 [Trichonephila clavipes]|uniref:Uncharacterized protein n=1 Tax=Trichonephila clavipes TaxID=2585209 RepID=A0A8X6S9R3_TRICX|nr:hypothetical protein TNCV_4662921 [Trichonephila clavipes]